MTRRSGPDGPEDVDAAFAEIVADLEREGVGVGMTEEIGPLDLDNDTPTAPIEPANPPSGWRPPDTSWSWTGPGGKTGQPEPPEPEEHYVPPEPPPLPRLRISTIFGLIMMLLGVLLLLAPKVIGLNMAIALPLALVSITSGIGWLMMHIKQGPPSGPDSDDDGAQV
ncbi:MAG TPA: DUF308 domain-containing protein [Pseudonocardiaceae bacterium]